MKKILLFLVFVLSGNPVFSQETVEKQNSYKGNNVMLGIGVGNSYGGIGIRVQRRIGDNNGFGVHAGVGYLPTAPILASFGVKYFPYRDLYINTQFGLVGCYKNGMYFDEKYNCNLFYGPSLLTGGDWNWGDKTGFGVNVGIGLTYILNYSEQLDSPIALAFDLGFIIRF